jgi:hypothetical protein
MAKYPAIPGPVAARCGHRAQCRCRRHGSMLTAGRVTAVRLPLRVVDDRVVGVGVAAVHCTDSAPLRLVHSLSLVYSPLRALLLQFILHC